MVVSGSAGATTCRAWGKYALRRDGRHVDPVSHIETILGVARHRVTSA
jgi:hypothetical protein